MTENLTIRTAIAVFALETYNWAGSFLRGKERAVYLEQSYREIRATMSDLGLAK